MDTSVGRAVENPAATEGAVSEKYCRSCNYAMREYVFECFTDDTKERYLVGQRTCSKCFRTEFFTPGVESENVQPYCQIRAVENPPEEEGSETPWRDGAQNWPVFDINSWDRKK